MYCTKCGSQNPEGSNFCHKCGEKLPLLQDEKSTPQKDAYPVQPAESERNTASEPFPKYNPACSQLGWHKFLVNFQLIIEGLFNLFIAYSYISGSGFGEARDYIYTNYPDMALYVKLNGFLYFALSLYTFAVRNGLAKFKFDAPRKLLYMYVFSALLALAGNLMAAPAFGGFAEAPGLIITPILYALVFILINYDYYKKREELFTKQ